MSEMVIKRLQQEDIPEVEDFFKKCKPLWFSSRAEEEDISGPSVYTAQTILLNPRIQYWGIWLGEELRLTFGTFDWDSLPYYSMIELRSTFRGQSVVFAKALKRVLQKIILFQESRGRTNFYFLASERQYYNRNGRGENGGSFLQSFIPELKEYIFFTEVVLKAKELPQWKVYQQMLNFSAPPVNVVVRRGSKQLNFQETSQISEKKCLDI